MDKPTDRQTGVHSENVAFAINKYELVKMNNSFVWKRLTLFKPSSFSFEISFIIWYFFLALKICAHFVNSLFSTNQFWLWRAKICWPISPKTKHSYNSNAIECESLFYWMMIVCLFFFLAKIWLSWLATKWTPTQLWNALAESFCSNENARVHLCRTKRSFVCL